MLSVGEKGINHPSSRHLQLIEFSVAKELELVPAVIGQGVGYILDRQTVELISIDFFFSQTDTDI